MIVYEYQRDIKQHLQTHAFTVHEMRLYKNTTNSFAKQVQYTARNLSKQRDFC